MVDTPEYVPSIGETRSQKSRHSTLIILSTGVLQLFVIYTIVYTVNDYLNVLGIDHSNPNDHNNNQMPPGLSNEGKDPRWSRNPFSYYSSSTKNPGT